MKKIVSYKTQNAAFSFDLPDVIDSLRYYATKHNVNEAANLIQSIELSSLEITEVSSPYFGYIVLDLLKKGKGSIFCKPIWGT